MPIILPDKTEACIGKALLYLEKLGLDENNKSDLDYALAFAKNVQGLCPDRDSGFIELEINSDINEDKIILTRDSRKNAGQIIEGLKILKKKIS